MLDHPFFLLKDEGGRVQELKKESQGGETEHIVAPKVNVCSSVGSSPCSATLNILLALLLPVVIG